MLAAGLIALHFAPNIGGERSAPFTVTIPVVTAISGFFALFVLVERGSFRWLVSLLAIFVVFVVLHTLYRSGVPEEFRVRRLIPIMRMALYGGTFSLFTASFGILVFLQFPIWIFAVVVAIASGFIIWSLLRMADLAASLALPSALVLALLTFELFWVITFLPIGYAISGWLLTGALYMMVQGTLVKLHGTERLQKRSIERLVIAFAAVTLVVIFSRWV